MADALSTCPNCQAIMNVGESCPECDHDDRGDCTCDHCSMATPYEIDCDDDVNPLENAW